MYTREDMMRAKARAFHEKYPQVWDYFVRFTMDRINLGFDHYSADAIMHRVRWETSAGDSGRLGDGFKINNNFVTFYAEGFIKAYPQHAGFFRFRERLSGRSLAMEE